MEWRVLVLKHLVPGLGDIIALMMFLSPLTAVLRAARAKTLGPLNPIPMAAMIANCSAWAVYAFLTTDPYVLVPNFAGLLLGTFMTLTCYGLAEEGVRHQVLAAWLGFSGVLLAAGTAVSFGGFDHTAVTSIWGHTAVSILIIYYAAPLSVMAEVVRHRNAAPLHPPLAAMSCANGTLWTVYGLAVNDPFIWGPNALGTATGVLQLGLIAAFPRKAAKALPTSENSSEDGEHMLRPVTDPEAPFVRRNSSPTAHL